MLEKALRQIPAAQLWVNPDCGLKTRKWDEVLPALQGPGFHEVSIEFPKTVKTPSAIRPMLPP